MFSVVITKQWSPCPGTGLRSSLGLLGVHPLLEGWVEGLCTILCRPDWAPSVMGARVCHAPAQTHMQDDVILQTDTSSLLSSPHPQIES